MNRAIGMTILSVGLLLVTTALAASRPISMTHIRYRVVPGGVKAGRYQLEQVDLWRAGDNYAREDRTPNNDNEFLSTVIAADSNLWTVHEKWRYAFHYPNSDSTARGVEKIFHGARLHIYGDLEFGHEREYFARHGVDLPPRAVHRKPCRVSQVVVDSTTLTLFLLESSQEPFVLSVVDGRYDYEIRYDRYEATIPFDNSLFVLPDSVRVIE